MQKQTAGIHGDTTLFVSVEDLRPINPRQTCSMELPVVFASDVAETYAEFMVGHPLECPTANVFSNGLPRVIVWQPVEFGK